MATGTVMSTSIPHQPEPHTSGRRGSRGLEKKNPCGWPLTWGIHSLKERETVMSTIVIY